MTELFYREPKFYAEGDVRGQVCHYGGLKSAIDALKRDRRWCASRGRYSDAQLQVYLRYAIGGQSYGVDCELDDGGEILLTNANCMNPQRVLKAIGEAIADGAGTYRVRLKCDDWKGWVVDGGALYKVSIRWPDREETTQQLCRRIKAQHICDVRA